MAKQMPSGLPEPDPGYEWRVDLDDQWRLVVSAERGRGWLALYAAWIVGVVCGVVSALTILGLTGAIR